MDPSIYQSVSSVFSDQGIPAYVWAPIMQMESSGNPNAIGDKGASIGLFQLNTHGGQGQGYTPDYLKNPVINAELASRAIAPAYFAVKDKYPATQLAAQVAIRSGHPGGSITHPLTGPAATSAINTLNTLARSYMAGQSAGPQAPSAPSGGGPAGGGLGGLGIPNPLDALGSSLSGVNQFFTGINQTLAAIDPLGISIAFFGVMILLIVIFTSLAAWSISPASPLRQVTDAAGVTKGAA